MLNENSVKALPDYAIVHVFTGGCFLYASNKDKTLKEDLEQLKTEILRRMEEHAK